MIDLHDIRTAAEASALDAELMDQSGPAIQYATDYLQALLSGYGELETLNARAEALAKPGAVGSEVTLARARVAVKAKALRASLTSARHSPEACRIFEDIESRSSARLAVLDRWVNLGQQEGINVDWPRDTAVRIRQSLHTMRTTMAAARALA